MSGLVGGQQKQRKRKELISVSADRANFKELIPGASRATLWGDPETGPYAAFTKFAPGFDAGLHTHSHDVWIVVLKGSYIYRDDEGEKRVGPGGVPSHSGWEETRVRRGYKRGVPLLR